MSNQIYTQASISEAGYKLADKLLTPRYGKIVATLQPLAGGKKVSAYLETRLMPDTLPTEPYPLPEDYVITKVTKEGTNGYFIVGEPKDKKKATKVVKTPAEAEAPQVEELAPGALPIKIGDNIHLRSKLGTYKVVFLTRDIIAISCKAWAKDYIANTRITPIETILWDDFKCKDGGNTNES